MTTVNSNRVANTNTMHPTIHASSLVVYEMGGVTVDKDPNMEAKVSSVVMDIVTRPERSY